VITETGKYHIKRYFAGQVPAIGSSIALGMGSLAPTLLDQELNFEIIRTNVTSVSYNFLTNKLVFKARVPEATVANVYELGLFSQEINAAAGRSGNKLLVTFDAQSEQWTGTPLWSTLNTRLGATSLRQAPAGSATVANEFNGTFDLGGYSNVDQFLIAYNNADTNAAAVEVRFEVDDTNYYRYTVTNPTAGYKVDSVLKSSLVSVGSPNWDKIAKIQVSTTSKSGVVATVDWDGIRIADTDTINPNYVLVARETLATPFSIKGGSVSEIEFSMAITV
jgi:hypothetical protein